MTPMLKTGCTLLLKLCALHMMDKDNTEEADNLTDLMDANWRDLLESERRNVSDFSAAMYEYESSEAVNKLLKTLVDPKEDEETKELAAHAIIAIVKPSLLSES